MILDMAMGGSTNTVLHILAIAHEAGVPFTLERIDELSQQTPNICKVSPSSKLPHRGRARAGGIHTILGEIARGCPGLLDLSLPDRHRQDARREHRRVRHPQPSRASAEAAASELAGGRPAGGVDAAIAADGLAVLDAEGEVESASSSPATSDSGFDPFDVHPRRSTTPTRQDGRADDALRQPRPQGRGGQDGRRRARRCSSTPARR